MKESIRKVFPACLGSCFAVMLVELFRHPGVRGIGDFLLKYLITCVVTTAIVSLCHWAFGRLSKRKKE